MKKKIEEPKKRYFATCTYCRAKYESDADIEPCCTSIMVNDRETLKSIHKVKK